jgi:hypothetical protein
MVLFELIIGLRVALFAFIACAIAGCGKTYPSHSSATLLRPVDGGALRSVVDFAVIPDASERSRAIFLEATRVMFHPRCQNCHPDGDVPLQGMAQELHDPPVERGVGDAHGDHGLPALACTSCHQEKNLADARVPGAPKWALAPRSMTWQHRTPGQLCEQLKDTKRNGGKSIDAIVEHSAHDELLAWGWAPGHGREPAPGTQAGFAALMRAWADLGAACPVDPSARAAQEAR